MVLNTWKRGWEGFAHSVVLLFFWHLGVDDDTGSMEGGERVEGERLNAYRRAGVRMQLGVVREGRLLVADLLADPSFSGSVRGAIVVVGSCFFPVLFLLRFHPF